MATPGRILSAAAAVGSAIAAPATNPNACNVAGPGVTYKGAQMYSATGDWTIQHVPAVEQLNFSYTFNICGDVNNPPAACLGAPTAPAYQWINSTTSASCNYLGISVAKGNVLSPQSSLYDVNNPTNGFVMTYIAGSGNGCSNGVGRQFSLVFQCARFPAPPPGVYPFGWVDETNECQYEAYIRGNAGCPQECPTGPNGAMCSDNGICGYDRNIMAARCFCDDDYMDADCSNPRSPFPTGTIAGTTIAGMMVGAAGIFGFSYWRFTRGGTAAGAVDGFYGQVQ